MEEYSDTNREEGTEPMDIEGVDRSIGDTSHHDGPMDGSAMESDMGVDTTADEHGNDQEVGNGGEANDQDQPHQRSSRRVVKPRVVYLAEIENPRGGDGNKQRKRQAADQGGVFGLQVGNLGVSMLILFEKDFF